MNNWNLLVVLMTVLAAGLFAPEVHAQTYTVLYSSPYNIGVTDVGVQGVDGNLYGETSSGGIYGDGTLITVTLGGQETLLHNFESGPGGANPTSLILGSDGNLFGTAAAGGVENCEGSGVGCGTIFGATAGGRFRTLHKFNGAGGNLPLALIEGANGKLYGVTDEGGENSCGSGGCRTIFSLTSSGAFTSLVNFDNLDGYQPNSIMQGADGNFYGTTSEGGAYGLYGSGSVFQMTPSGALTTLYSFCQQSGCPDGYVPVTLLQGADGNLYGIATLGGRSNTSYCSLGCGTFFKLTLSGELTTLRDFCLKTRCTDGADPLSMIRGSDGNFYGISGAGGTNDACKSADGCGTIFRLTTDGTLTTLYSFCAASDCADGYSPTKYILQDTNGMFYGSTEWGGEYHYGVVFSLSAGLPPFIEATRAAAKVGAKVGILGTELTGTTSVTFNGVPAPLTVQSATYIVASVPAGATSGIIQAVTPGGTLSSNVPFKVLKQ